MIREFSNAESTSNSDAILDRRCASSRILMFQNPVSVVLKGMGESVGILEEDGRLNIRVEIQRGKRKCDPRLPYKINGFLHSWFNRPFVPVCARTE